MKRKISVILSFILLLCLGFTLVSCKKKEVQNNPEKDIYSEKLLLNGFDNNEDLYKVRQHTYMQNDKWTGYSAEGKLQIVGTDNFALTEVEVQNPDAHKAEDMAPRQGDGALRIHYISQIEGVGNFTQLIARFARTEYKDIPVDRIGGLSVHIYNDNSEAREVTLSLVKSDLSIVNFGGNSVTLAPYAWTECMVDFNPAIVEYFKNDVVGLSVEFNQKEASVYYLDDLCLTFEQVYTDEIKEYVELVKALEKDIDMKVVGKTITSDSKDTLSDLFKRYLELPVEYQDIVGNYAELETAITKYMTVSSDEELKNTGSVTALRFNEIFGLTQIANTLGCSVSYTTEEHAPGEEGSLCVEFDGNVDWTGIGLLPYWASHEEVHVWIKDDSEYARVFNIDWKTLAATNGVAYDKQEKEIINSLDSVEYNNNIVTENGWVKLVFKDQLELKNFNIVSYITKKGQVTKSQGKLYIGKVWVTSKVAELMNRIDALEEKSSYSDKELLEILDLYLATFELSKEHKNVLGLERVEKIERLYKGNATKIMNVKIKSLRVKDEYAAAEIKEINDVKKLYDNLSAADKAKVNITNLNRVLEKVAGYDKNGKNMDVTAYDASYSDRLYYSTKEVYAGEKFSVKYQTEIKDGNFVSITLPEPISNAKKLKIAVKNTSDQVIAFWPKVCDTQGALWLEPKGHEVLVTAEEDWVELVYDIEGLTIDSLLATYGPWKNGDIQFYIGKIELVTDLSKEVAGQLKKLSALLSNTEFTASEIRQILELKEAYSSLSQAEKKKINTKKLQELLAKISKYDKSGKNMNVLAYDKQFENMLSYSLKEVLKGEAFSMKIATKITNKDAVTIPMAETVTGKKLTITLRNTSDKDIAIWPRATEAYGGAWLLPTNHDEQPIIKAEEGWVELTYNIDAIAVDAWVVTYGPWENGALEIYIGKMRVSKDGLADLKQELAKLPALADKDEFTAAELTWILDLQKAYEKLSAAEKKQLDATVLQKLMQKIAAYDTGGIYMDITKYNETYKDALLYSLKEKEEGSDFSIKIDKEIGADGTHFALPKVIYGNKKLTLTVKNVSDEPIAIWPKVIDTQGGTWLVPMNHGEQPIVTAEEGWVELTYDITDKTIDAVIATLGPWQDGQLGIYIGRMEVSNSFASDVEKAIAEIAALLAKDEFTANEIQQIIDVKQLYDNRLTEAEKETINAGDLLEAVAKIEGYDVAGTNMDITKYNDEYSDMLYYSTGTVAEGKDFSLKVQSEIGAGEAYIYFPEVITGKTLSISFKNTSDSDIAIWPQAAAQNGAWLNPSNHGESPIVKAEEGWVTLTYNIDGQNIDRLVMTLGPWESGQIEFYIGGMDCITTYLPAVKAELDAIADILVKNEFTASEIRQIMAVKESYDSKLSVSEKEALGATGFLAAVDKVQHYNQSGTNMNITLYGEEAQSDLLYSTVEKLNGQNFSLKVSKEMGTGEAYIYLPEVIKNAKTLTITVKNTSDQPIAFWPHDSKQNGAPWLTPTNHGGNPILEASEGFVELTYDINGQNVDRFVMTYGPWQSGQMDFYIGSMQVSSEATNTLKPIQIVSTTGSTYTETVDGMKVDFDGTAPWCDVNINTISAGKEIHIFFKNDSDSRRIVSLNWNPATKVYDENGNDITSSILEGRNTTLPANSGWIEVVYTATSGNQLNCCSLVGETGGEAKNSVGSLYIRGYITE